MKLKNIMMLLLVVVLIVATAKAALASVYINEIFTDPTASSAADLWIELYSDTGEDISGWMLTDEEGIYIFPAGTSVAAGGYKVIGEEDFPFRFFASDDLWLYTDATRTILIDNINYTYTDPANQVGWSVARIHDGDSQVILSNRFTMNRANNRLPVLNPPLVITAPAYLNSEITCSITASDPDADLLTIRYIWTTSGGEDLTSFTATNPVGIPATLDLRAVEGESQGDTITCSAMAIDGIENSAAETATTLLHNRAPDISSILLDGVRVTDTAELTESVTAVLKLLASDDDGDSIEIDMDSSNLDGVPLSGLGWVTLANNLELRFTPGNADIGSYTLTLVVTDEQAENPTDEVSFPLVVHPVLSILSDSVAVEVNGVSLNTLETIPAAPGDLVTVRFSFRNYYNRVLGHVETQATTAPSSISDFFPYEGTCRGVNCSRGDWALVPGSVGSDEFTFQIPAAIAVNAFTLDLNVHDDSFWSFLSLIEFADTLSLEFAVQRSEVEILLTAATLADDSLTCTRTAELAVELVNAGTFRDGGVAVAPELLVYNRRGNTFDPVTGEFTSFVGGLPTFTFERNLYHLDPGTNTRRVLIDASSLAEGASILYVYIANPYLDSSDAFVRGPIQVPIMVEPCLASFTPAGDSLIVADGEVVEFSAVPGEEEFVSDIIWFVDDVVVAAGEQNYSFVQYLPGAYEVRLELLEEEHIWTVTVTDVPLSSNFETNIPDDVTEGELAAFDNFTISNTFGQIRFTEPVDLRELADVDAVFVIANGLAAVDTAAAPELADIPAEITFFRTFTDFTVEFSSGFNAGAFSDCPATRCELVSNAAGKFVFTVSGFSTYRVIEEGDEPPAPEETTGALVIEDLEINGDDDGELALDKTNEIEVKVRNAHTLDIEDITVTVTLFDIDDGDDLDEESDEFDLDVGNDEAVTLEFDLQNVDMDDDSFTMEIKVEGRDTNGTRHKTIERRTVDLDLEQHKVIINKATLGLSTLQCQRQTDLRLTLKNIGKSDEDDVEVLVESTALDIELRRSGLELDKFIDTNNERSLTLVLEVEDAAPSRYPLTVELYRDGQLDDTEEVELDVRSCGTAATTVQPQVQYAGEQLVQELQQQLQAGQQAQPIAGVRSSFRDSNAYLALLGVLTVLLLIAVILAVGVAARKR